MIETADKRSALAPDPQSLSDRGHRAWTEQMAVRPLGEEYAVDSQSGATYIVDIKNGECDCPDQMIRGQLCKHLRRVAIEITLGRVPPPGMIRSTCTVCAQPIFVGGDRTGFEFCPVCRLAPGDRVTDRNTGDQLVVTSVTGHRADEVMIRETDAAVADHPTNDGYPADDPVVEVIYASKLTSEEAPRRYLFPYSRLQKPSENGVSEDDMATGGY